MEQLLYQLIEWTARANGLLDMVMANQETIVTAITVLALASSLFGFYLYRGVVSVLVFLTMTLIGGCWIGPAWGEQARATFGAVLGIAVAFLAFRWYRLGTVGLCAAIAAGWTWNILGPQGWFFAVLLGIAAGGIAFCFPFWSVCGFTAAWGGVTFAALGGELLPIPQPILTLLGIVLIPAGLTLQLILFRRQTLFDHIMPKRMEYTLEKFRRDKEGAA